MYTTSSGSTFASSVAQYNRPSDGPDAWSAPQTLTAGSATFTGTGWGPYVTVATDPQVPTAVWVGDPAANGSGGWTTTVHELSVGDVGAGYVPVTHAGYDLAKQQGWFTQNPGTELPVKQLTRGQVTDNSRGFHLGRINARAQVDECLAQRGKLAGEDDRIRKMGIDRVGTIHGPAGQSEIGADLARRARQQKSAADIREEAETDFGHC